MSTAILLSSDTNFWKEMQLHLSSLSTTIQLATNEKEFKEGLSLQPATLLVDLNMLTMEDPIAAIAHAKSAENAPNILAFLHENAGDTIIKARLAGADRVIPRQQLLDELLEILAD